MPMAAEHTTQYYTAQLSRLSEYLLGAVGNGIRGRRPSLVLRAPACWMLFLRTRKASAASLPPAVQGPLYGHAPLHSPNTIIPRVGGWVLEIGHAQTADCPKNDSTRGADRLSACEKKERKLRS